MNIVEKMNELSLSALNNPICDMFIKDSWNRLHLFIKGHHTNDELLELDSILDSHPITAMKHNEIHEMFIDEMLEKTADERELRKNIESLKNETRG